MGKVKIKQLLLYPVSHDASVPHDLCGMRDDDFCGIFTTAQLKQLIIDISSMYSQQIYLHFGGSYTSFTQLEAEIHALEYKCASNTGPFSLLFLIPKMTYYFRMFLNLI